jgi:hypothetical protein
MNAADFAKRTRPTSTIIWHRVILAKSVSATAINHRHNGRTLLPLGNKKRCTRAPEGVVRNRLVRNALQSRGNFRRYAGWLSVAQ